MIRSESGWPRIIAHADMDAFYAAIEQLDDPMLPGIPVLYPVTQIDTQAVCGVVSTDVSD